MYLCFHGQTKLTLSSGVGRVLGVKKRSMIAHIIFEKSDKQPLFKSSKTRLDDGKERASRMSSYGRLQLFDGTRDLDNETYYGGSSSARLIQMFGQMLMK